MAIRAAVEVANGIRVAGCYIRTRKVESIGKDRVGDQGIYAVYSAEAFKSAQDAANGKQALQVDGGLTFKITNLEDVDGLTGAIVPDAFGVLYADLKQRIVGRGWEPDLASIEDLQ